jgi:hypothetical protein
MKYTKAQLFEDVAREATLLKETATQIELQRISFYDLDPRYYTKCIYGQMTGDCFSDRAAYLIFNCCPRYFRSHSDDDDIIEDVTKSKAAKLEKFVNGESVPGVKDSFGLKQIRSHGDCHYSAIETYIMQPYAKNKNLIDFLRGRRGDLVL